MVYHVKPASHRLRGKGLTRLTIIICGYQAKSRWLKAIRNAGSHFSGIMALASQNIQKSNNYF
jgi:hypothetical protein